MTERLKELLKKVVAGSITHKAIGEELASIIEQAEKKEKLKA